MFSPFLIVAYKDRKWVDVVQQFYTPLEKNLDSAHELMEKVKAQRQTVEVIIMTGYATVEPAVKAMKNGAYDYLSKPFEMDELMAKVRKIVPL